MTIRRSIYRDNITPATRLAGLMGLVAFLALGLTALRTASEAWVAGCFLGTVGILVFGALRALWLFATLEFGVRASAAIVWWSVFALVGGSHLILALEAQANPSAWNIPTHQLSQQIVDLLPTPERRTSLDRSNAQLILQMETSLVLGLLGGWLAQTVLFWGRHPIASTRP